MPEIGTELLLKILLGNVCFIVQVGIFARERKQDRLTEFNC